MSGRAAVLGGEKHCKKEPKHGGRFSIEQIANSGVWCGRFLLLVAITKLPRHGTANI